MKNTIRRNLIIFIRHGERSDRVPGFVPEFHKFDPELTKNGKRQALDIGTILSEFLLDKYPSFKKVIIITSPFARTIQTSKNLLKGISKNLIIENDLKINYFFSEFIKDDFPTHDFPSFLVVKNEYQKLFPELEETKLTFINKPEDIISKRYEDEEICKKRVQKGLEELLSSIYDERKEEHVYIVVSHGDPINFANIEFGYPGPFGWRNIKYCNSFIYEVDFSHDEFEKVMYETKFIDQIVPQQY